MTTYSYTITFDEFDIGLLRDSVKLMLDKRFKESLESDDLGADARYLLCEQSVTAILGRMYDNSVMTSTNNFSDPERPRAPTPPKDAIKKSAEFSECRRYRYSLWRTWDESLPFVLFIGLNPSTADETKDDPTISKCIKFAKEWGYGGMCMVNLFAYRATKPSDMKKADDPVGPQNDAYIRKIASDACVIIAAWGNEGVYKGRSKELSKVIARPLDCLGVNATGEPRHPLFVEGSMLPMPYRK